MKSDVEFASMYWLSVKVFIVDLMDLFSNSQVEKILRWVHEILVLLVEILIRGTSVVFFFLFSICFVILSNLFFSALKLRIYF